MPNGSKLRPKWGAARSTPEGSPILSRVPARACPEPDEGGPSLAGLTARNGCLDRRGLDLRDAGVINQVSRGVARHHRGTVEDERALPRTAAIPRQSTDSATYETGESAEIGI